MAYITESCTHCRKGGRALYRLVRFPEVHVCWDCLRMTQLGLVKLLGEKVVREILYTDAPHFLFHISDGHFAIDSNTATAAQAWSGWNQK